MSNDRYIPGVPCWVDTDQPDPEAATAFYGALFGWEFEDRMPADAPGSYYMATLRGQEVAAIGSPPEEADGPPVWSTYVWVADADETAAKVRAAGGAVVAEPFDVMGAGRMAIVTDPDGARFSLWQPGRHRGATLVNEHGSLNFNDLHTPDLDRAAAFYGAVFGWELLEVDDGHMWAMKEYGDFLEELMPGMRSNMAEMGAPPRFEEVVASIDGQTDSATGAGPHWSVTFGVDDADAIASRASELGGRVLVEPHDLPWVRATVIEDPQGAVFVASQFVPPSG